MNLANRFRQYLRQSFLKYEIKKNNSKIYRSLIKNGYSNFKLEILEYCDKNIILNREQYFLDKLSPYYNILKKAGSNLGFKHSEDTKELMRLRKLNSIVSEETKLKIAQSLAKGNSILIKNINTGEYLSFLSIRKAAKWINVHVSYVAKSLSLNKFFYKNGYLIFNSKTSLENIFTDGKFKLLFSEKEGKHTEKSKELIRKANLGKILSQEIKNKISLNSKNAKPVLLINNQTKENLRFPSCIKAALFLNVDESYIRRCLKFKKVCKGFTIIR